uniref:G protein-coupled receptor n=1 Tax=Perna canaliculus TaxID=38949 RepID=C6YB48_PERCI|nr:G protein-coupled receptor [Perna canaliculus]
MLIAFMALQQLVFVVSVVGNAIVLIVFIKYLRFKAYSNRFVVSLALSDLITGLATGLQMYFILYPTLSTSLFLCIARYEVIGYMASLQQVTVCLAAFDRYVAICHPHKYSKIVTRTTSNVMAVTPWIVLAYKIIYPLVKMAYLPTGIRCRSKTYFSVLYRGVIAIFVYIISFITFAFYILILKVAWRFHRKIGAMDSKDNHRSKTIAKDITRAKVTGIVAVVFSVCWLPYMAFRLRDMANDSQRGVIEQTISNWMVFLGIFNCLANPLIYAWKRPDFRQSCKSLFSCKKA